MRPAASVLVLAFLVALPVAGLVGAQHVEVPGLLGPSRQLPIVVHGNSGFLLPPDVSGVRGGHGSALDPYRIEGWSIVSLPFNPSVGNLGYSNVWVPCILLQNTDAHVVIRSNFIKGNNCHGIWLQNASNVRVEDNVIEHNTGHGVFVESFGPPALGKFGCNLEIRRNYLKANGFDGVRVFHALFVEVEDNQIIANANFGLIARAVEGLEVRGNQADHNGVAGVIVEMTPGAVLERNTARHNPTGLDVEFSPDVVVQDNVAEDNRDLGIYTSEMSLRTLVQRNVLRRNGLLQGAGWNDGLSLGGIDEVARDNVVEGNRDGVSVAQTAAGSLVERNAIRANERGVVLEACPGTVRANAIGGNGLGVAVPRGDCTGLSGNNLAGNALGARADAGASVAMAGNWWGAPSGPRAPGNPGGAGDRVEGAVSVAPWLAAPALGAPLP